jgi:hypothetical protein
MFRQLFIDCSQSSVCVLHAAFEWWYNASATHTGNAAAGAVIYRNLQSANTCRPTAVTIDNNILCTIVLVAEILSWPRLSSSRNFTARYSSFPLSVSGTICNHSTKSSARYRNTRSNVRRLNIDISHEKALPEFMKENSIQACTTESPTTFHNTCLN